MIFSCLGITEQFTIITKVNDASHSRRICGARDGKEAAAPFEKVVWEDGWESGPCPGSRTPRCGPGLSIPTTSSLSCHQPAFSKVAGELLPEAGPSFPRYLWKRLDQNSPVFSWLLHPAFLLFIMLDGKPMQMLYFGKMLGMTEKKPQTSPELEAADAPGKSW